MHILKTPVSTKIQAWIVEDAPQTKSMAKHPLGLLQMNQATVQVRPVNIV